MQDLASRLWSPTSRFHPGQLAWSRYCRPVDPAALDDGEAIAVWTEAGETLGFGWAEAPDWLELQVDPARPDVAEEVIEWFEEVSDAETQSALVMEGDVAEQALGAAGFAPQPDEPFFTHHAARPRRPPSGAGVPGYRLRHVEPHEAREPGAVHAASWSDVGPVEGRRAGLPAAHGAPGPTGPTSTGSPSTRTARWWPPRSSGSTTPTAWGSSSRSAACPHTAAGAWPVR